MASKTQYMAKYLASEKGKKALAEYRKSGKAKIAQERFQRNNPLKYMLNRTRGSAKRRGLEFSLSEADFPVLPEYCPVFGMRLKYPGDTEGADDPAIASLDRINNSMGYIAGNVVIISLRANKIKRDASLEDLRALVAWLETKH